MLKSHIYELVRSNDPQERLHVVDLEKETDASKIEIVYGVGVAAQIGVVGYKPIRIEELSRAVVFDNVSYSAEQIILHTLPELLRNSQNVPVFKYLRQAGYIGEAGKDPKNLPPSVQKAMKRGCLAYAPKCSTQKKAEIRAAGKSIQDLEKKYGLEKSIVHAHYLDQSALKPDLLGEFLKLHFDEMWKSNSNNRTYLRKLVCLYDQLKYGPNVKE